MTSLNNHSKIFSNHSKMILCFALLLVSYSLRANEATIESYLEDLRSSEKQQETLNKLNSDQIKELKTRLKNESDIRKLLEEEQDKRTGQESPSQGASIFQLNIGSGPNKYGTPKLNQNSSGSKSSSDLFRECEGYIPKGKSWPEVTAKKSSNTEAIWEQAWEKFENEQAEKLYELNEKKVSEENAKEEVKFFYKKFNEKLKDFHDTIAKCEAMRALTAYSDIDKNSLKWGAEATKKSVDGKIVCKSVGPETQDYKACLTALNSYNAALVGTAVFTQIQTVKYQGDSIENAAGVNPNNPTSALEVQKRDIEGRANITQQRAGLDAAKLAGMGALLYSMPTPQKLLTSCGELEPNRIKYRPIEDKFNELIQKFYGVKIRVNQYPPQNQNINEKDLNLKLSQIKERAVNSIKESHPYTNPAPMKNYYCKQALNDAGGTLILNTAAKDEIKRAMIVAGVDMTKHQLTANQLKKQANQVGKIINEVDNFNPEDLPQFQGQDFNGSECVLDPSAEGCDDFVDERSFGFQDRGAIQINGLENASSFSRNSDDPRSRGDDDSGSGDFGGNTAPPKPIGIFDPRVADKSGFDGRMPSAAGVTSNGPEAAQGGSGGGPSGGGSPPASQVPQQKSDDGPRLGGAGNSTANYSGGGGSLRTRGGGGSLGRGSSDDEDGNPFAELFGDKDPTRSETLNFRETASAENQINTPDTSIFEIISERYTNVRKQDRLLEYKVKNSEELQ